MVKTTYLEMHACPPGEVPPPCAGLSVTHWQRPTVGDYRALYDAVGRDYDWTSRKKLSDEKLAAILDDPLNEVHVLHVEGIPAGFAELDRRQPGEIEIVQFGLTGPYIGRGLGRWFLRWTIEKAWSYGPNRLWLHTCTNDHTKALPNYQQAGFEIYREETRGQEA